MKIREKLNHKGIDRALTEYCRLVGADPISPTDMLEVIQMIEHQMGERDSYQYEVCSSHTISKRPERIDLDNDSFWHLVEIEEEE